MKPSRRAFLFHAVTAGAFATLPLFGHPAPGRRSILNDPAELLILRKALAAAEANVGQLRERMRRCRQQFISEGTSRRRMTLFQRLHQQDLSHGNMLDLAGFVVTPAEWALLAIWAKL